MTSSPVVSVQSRPATDILEFCCGKSSAVALEVEYRKIFDATQPGPAELNLAFQMLDALLLNIPFDQWEN